MVQRLSFYKLGKVNVNAIPETTALMYVTMFEFVRPHTFLFDYKLMMPFDLANQ